MAQRGRPALMREYLERLIFPKANVKDMKFIVCIENFEYINESITAGDIYGIVNDPKHQAQPYIIVSNILKCKL